MWSPGRIVGRIRARLIDAAYTVARLIFRPETRRAAAWGYFGKPRDCFQYSNFTQENRYPEIFADVASVVPIDTTGLIVSFGCSTGHEVFALRATFSNARIVGIDINPDNIVECYKLWEQHGRDPRISFRCANSCNILDKESACAVMALSVFCDSRLRDNLPASALPWLRFEDFARETASIAKILADEGIFVMANTNFQLASLENNPFRVIKSFNVQQLRTKPMPLYDAKNNIMPNSVGLGGIYLKI